MDTNWLRQRQQIRQFTKFLIPTSINSKDYSAIASKKSGPFWSNIAYLTQNTVEIFDSSIITKQIDGDIKNIRIGSIVSAPYLMLGEAERAVSSSRNLSENDVDFWSCHSSEHLCWVEAPVEAGSNHKVKLPASKNIKLPWNFLI